MEKVENVTSALSIPTVYVVQCDRPIEWLKAGWNDIRKAPMQSLAYGLVFSSLGWVLLASASISMWLVLSLFGAFLLLGPVTANGLYEVSRRLETGEPVGFLRTATACRSPLAMFVYASFLTLIAIAWVRLTSLMVALSFSNVPAMVREDWTVLFTTTQGLAFLLMFLISGGLAMFVVFITGVVTLPLVKDRRQDIITSILTSVRVARANPLPMLLWAALLVGLSAFGLATLMIGLIVIFPLLAHATWHAYRDLVGPNENEAVD